ncbi:MAG: hypothetical protein LBQ82_00055 [Treponema sp.]|jgi:hypothetical protein|nr:hypothetical protein [Treponema sp.]
MKKNLLKSAFVLSIIAGLLVFAGCDEAPKDLDTPTNVTITVDGRTMTVSWNAVNGAQGYEVYTTSVGCGSGNRIINTKDNTATDHDGKASYLKSDKSNGAVEIKSATSIQITLMPMGEDNTKPMASKVTAKVRALGGESGGTNYLDSEYSAVTEKTLGGMGGM